MTSVMGNENSSLGHAILHHESWCKL